MSDRFHSLWVVVVVGMLVTTPVLGSGSLIGTTSAMDRADRPSLPSSGGQVSGHSIISNDAMATAENHSEMGSGSSVPAPTRAQSGTVPDLDRLTAPQRRAIDIADVRLRASDRKVLFGTSDATEDHVLVLEFAGELSQASLGAIYDRDTTYSGQLWRLTTVYIDADNDSETGATGDSVPPGVQGAEYAIVSPGHFRNGGVKKWHNGRWATLRNALQSEGASVSQLLNLAPARKASVTDDTIRLRLDYDGRRGVQPFSATDARVVTVSWAVWYPPQDEGVRVQADATNTTLATLLRAQTSPRQRSVQPYPSDFQTQLQQLRSAIRSQDDIQSIRTLRYTDGDLDAATVFQLWSVPVFRIAWNAGSLARGLFSTVMSAGETDLGMIEDLLASDDVVEFVFGDIARDVLTDVSRVSHTLDKYGSLRIIIAETTLGNKAVYAVVEEGTLNQGSWTWSDGQFETIQITQQPLLDLPPGADNRPPSDRTPERGDGTLATPIVDVTNPSTVAANTTITMTVNYQNTNDATAANLADGVHLRLTNATFTSIPRGEFDELRTPHPVGQGVIIAELTKTGSVPAGRSYQSGTLRIHPDQGAKRVVVNYRGWSFDEDDTNPLGNPWIGRTPDDTPLNKHVVDPSYTYLDYAVTTAEIRISPQRPTVSIQERELTDQTPTLSVTGSDPDGNVSGFEYAVDNGPWIAMTGSSTSVHLSSGSHTVSVRSVDSVGRSSPVASTTVTVQGSSWWDRDWQYRKRVTVTAHNGSLTQYPVTFTLDHGGYAQSDCADLRVIANGTPVRYAQRNCTAQQVSVVVRRNLSTTTPTTFDVYYGNRNAVSTAASWQAVYWDFYADFEQYAVGDRIGGTNGWIASRNAGPELRIERPAHTSVPGDRSLGSTSHSSGIAAGNTRMSDWSYPEMGFLFRAVVDLETEFSLPIVGIANRSAEGIRTGGRNPPGGALIHFDSSNDFAGKDDTITFHYFESSSEFVGRPTETAYEMRIIGYRNQTGIGQYRQINARNWRQTRATTTFDGTLRSTAFGLWKWGGQVDRMRVRRYVHSGPSVTVGPAETVPDGGQSRLGQYANANGVIDSDGLRRAINDWISGSINSSLLRDVIQAWISQTPV